MENSSGKDFFRKAGLAYICVRLCRGCEACQENLSPSTDPQSCSLLRGNSSESVQRFCHWSPALQMRTGNYFSAAEGITRGKWSLPRRTHSSSSGLTDFMCLWWFTSITLQHFHVQLTFSNLMVTAPWDWRWECCESHCLSCVSKSKQERNSCWKGVSWAHTQEGGFICLFIYFKNPLKYFSKHPRSKGLWSHRDDPRGRPLL